MIFENETMKRFLPLILWLLACFLIVVWLWTRPQILSFSLESEQNCSLRIYYSHRDFYQKKYSHSDAVVPCRKKYDYTLPRNTRKICLSLENCVRGTRLQFPEFILERNGIFKSYSRNPDSGVLKPLRDIVAVESGFKTTGPRPELEIAPDFISVEKPDIRKCSLLFLFFFMISLILFSCSADDWINLSRQIVRQLGQLGNYCRENVYFLFFMFGCLCILFGYELFHLPITADDDYHLVSQFEQYDNQMKGFFYVVGNTQEDVFISHGRWASALIYGIFTGFCPVMSLFCSLVSISLIFLLLAEKLKVPPTARYFLYPLFIGHPIFYIYFIFYMANNTYGLSCLAMFTAAVFCSSSRDWRIRGLVVLVALFFTCCVQSLILFFPMYFLLKKISDWLDRPIDYKKSFRELLDLCGMCLLILLAYYLSLRYSLWLYDVNWQYLAEFIHKPDSSWKAVGSFCGEMLKKIYSVYAGEFNFTVHGQLLLFLVMVSSILIHLIRKKRSRLDIAVMTVAMVGILILPFILDIASFNPTIPIRSMASFPLMMAGLFAIGWRSQEEYPKMRFVSGVLMVLVAVQYGIFINQDAYAAKLRNAQDRSILQSVKERCYRIPEFTSDLNKKKKIPLAVIGELPPSNYQSFPMCHYSIFNCAFDPALVVNMHLLGEPYFYPASPAELKRVLPVVMSMPSWPASGSVRYEKGIMIVKWSQLISKGSDQGGAQLISKDGNIHQVKKLPPGTRPVWSLNAATLDIVSKCQVKFADGKMILGNITGWPTLTTKEIDAAPEKIYYLHIKLRNSQTNGLLYLSLYDSSWYNDKSTVEFVVSRGNNDFIILIPGRYVKGPLYLEPGDWPDREQIFEKVVLLESSGKPAETDMADFISRKSR